MNTKEQVLQMLKRHAGVFLSGNALSQSLQITRAAVWKAVRSLREEGYQIEAVTNRGYCLAEPEGGFLEEESLKTAMPNGRLGRKLVLLKQVDSTNSYAKKLAEQPDSDGTVVVAETQTQGKGRMYRHFYSPLREGVYFSVVLHPDIHLDELNLLTLTAALSVVEAVEALTGTRPQIKWPNDVVWNGKKLCGILTESSVENETGRVQYTVSGIGINVNNRGFPDELKQTACSLRQIGGRAFSRRQVIAAVLGRLERFLADDWFLRHREEMLDEYRRDVALIGKEIDLIYPRGKVHGKVLGIDAKGGLLVRTETRGDTVIYSGEVSVR